MTPTARNRLILIGIAVLGVGWLLWQTADALVPFVFAEVKIPNAGPLTPRLRSRLPSRDWVFLWDARRKTGYVLAAPPMNGEAASLKFRVDRAWVEASGGR